MDFKREDVCVLKALLQFQFDSFLLLWQLLLLGMDFNGQDSDDQLE